MIHLKFHKFITHTLSILAIFISTLFSPTFANTQECQELLFFSDQILEGATVILDIQKVKHWFLKLNSQPILSSNHPNQTPVIHVSKLTRKNPSGLWLCFNIITHFLWSVITMISMTIWYYPERTLVASEHPHSLHRGGRNESWLVVKSFLLFG